MEEELAELTEKARRMCLSELGYTEENQKSAKNLLLGRCRSNSRTLKSILENNGYDAEIGGGVIGDSAWKKDIESFEKAIRTREPIHYWVRVERYICEVASECPRYYGEPIAVQQHPEQLGYIVFEDSYDGWHNKSV